MAVLFDSAIDAYQQMENKKRREQHGGRKLKVNFKLIKGYEIGTIVEGHKKVIGRLEQVRFDQKEQRYCFSFENGFTLKVLQAAFYYHTILHREEDTIFFEFSTDTILSGMIVYSLYETCGLPLEFAIDEMDKQGIPIDEEGFRIMEEIQRNKSKGTFKNKNAFN